MDSNPATWSHNADTHGAGIIWVYGKEGRKLSCPKCGWLGLKIGISKIVRDGQSRFNIALMTAAGSIVSMQFGVFSQSVR
jgi:hypothetical protein